MPFTRSIQRVANGTLVKGEWLMYAAEDVLYDEPERVLAEDMARGREPSVVSHDTSGRDRVGSEAKRVVELMSTPTRRAVI